MPRNIVTRFRLSKEMCLHTDRACEGHRITRCLATMEAGRLAIDRQGGIGIPIP